MLYIVEDNKVQTLNLANVKDFWFTPYVDGNVQFTFILQGLPEEANRVTFTLFDWAPEKYELIQLSSTRQGFVERRALLNYVILETESIQNKMNGIAQVIRNIIFRGMLNPECNAILKLDTPMYKSESMFELI